MKKNSFKKIAILNVNLKGRNSEISETKDLCIANFETEEFIIINQNISQVNIKYFIGSGKVEYLKQKVIDEKIDIIVCSYDIPSVQQINLEKAIKCKLMTRSDVIIDIFEKHSNSHTGKIKVKLARLKSQRGKLIRLWTHLERQRGSIGYIGGPGEKQIEIDKRMIDKKIINLEEKLKKVIKVEADQSKNRKKNNLKTVSIIGHTNVGKSTLFNLICSENREVKNEVFTTLETKTKKVTLKSNFSFLITDTVGFIENLPEYIYETFHSTFQETLNSDLLIVVFDISSPHLIKQKENIKKLFKKYVGNKKKSVIFLYNKYDQIIDINRKIKREKNSLLISARTKKNISNLIKKIEKNIFKNLVRVKVDVCEANQEYLSQMFFNCYKYEHKDNFYLFFIHPIIYQKIKNNFISI